MITTSDAHPIPVSSQTVGPYFRIGLGYLIERTPAIAPQTTGWIEIRGRVLDRDGAPVPDAMLEFWGAEAVKRAVDEDFEHNGFPIGFRRAMTDIDGNFAVTVSRPKQLALGDGSMQAPHLLVLVFARGLLRHLLSRLYFEDEPANFDDPVLKRLPAERRPTLIAQQGDNQASIYRWNVVLQGPDETVFFAW